MADGFRHDDLMRWALGKNLDTKENPAGYVGVSSDALKAYSETVKGSDWSGVMEANFFVTVDGKVYKSPYNTSAATGTGAKVDRVWNDKYYLEPIPISVSVKPVKFCEDNTK